MADFKDDDIYGMKKKYRFLGWRLANVTAFFCWIVFFLLRFFVFRVHSREYAFIPAFVYVVCYSLSIVIFAALIVLPLKLQLHMLVAFIWGVVRLIEGRTSQGVLWFLIAVIFAYQLGFFRKQRVFRTALLVIIFFTASFLQLRHTPFPTWLVILRYMEFFLGIGFIIFFFWPEIQHIRKERHGGVLRLSAPKFTKKDVLMLRKVLAGEKYGQIAKDLNMAEITLKKRIRDVYNRLGVDDRVSFLTRYSNFTVTSESDE